MALITVAVLVVCMTGGGAATGRGRPRVYEGPLGEEGATIQFELVKREDRPMAMRSFSFEATLTCDIDGSVQEWGVGMGWGGGLPKLPSHALDLDDVSGDAAIHLHGTIQAVHGSGTLSFAVAQMTQDEQAQTCSTGELAWTVDRTVPPVESPTPPPAIQVLHVVTASGARVTMTQVA
jgi:hypothetical protein